MADMLKCDNPKAHKFHGWDEANVRFHVCPGIRAAHPFEHDGRYASNDFIRCVCGEPEFAIEHRVGEGETTT